MAANNYQQVKERDNPEQTASIYKIESINMLIGKLDNMVQMLNKHVVVGSSSNFNVSMACYTTCGDEHEDSICSNIVQV